jgi:hypothetical protein
MENKFSKLIIAGVFLLIFFTGIIWADSNGIWHNAEDIRGGTFGNDEPSAPYAFITPVSFDDLVSFGDDIEVSGDLKVDTIRSNSGGNLIIVLG